MADKPTPADPIPDTFVRVNNSTCGYRGLAREEPGLRTVAGLLGEYECLIEHGGTFSLDFDAMEAKHITATLCRAILALEKRIDSND